MKKVLLLFWLAWLVFFQLPANGTDEQLIKLISEKKWADLVPLFQDDSYSVLEAYFQKFLSVEFVVAQSNQLIYKAKSRDYAEIGNLSFTKENNLFAKLKIGNQIKPILFIDSFKKYAVENRTLKIGDAEIIFSKGHFYQAWPAKIPLIFEGQWNFRLTPGDAEEHLTLNRFFKSETFFKPNTSGIFILQDLGILTDAQFSGDVPALPTPELLDAFALYQKYFGIPIKQFNELWYLPIADNDNLLIFPKDNKSYYLFDFNDQISPDTQLRTSDDHKIILSYNAVKEMKLNFGKDEGLEELKLFLFCNPEKNSLSGTANLLFVNSVPFRTLHLDMGLKIKANVDLDSIGISVVRKNQFYYILGPETNRLTFYYGGNIKFEDDYSDLFKFTVSNNVDQTVDQFFFLSRSQNYYPNPGNNFFKSSVKINVPGHFNCLASGKLTESKAIQDRNIFQFTSPGAKGVSLICGDFKSKMKLDTMIPVNVFAHKNFHFEKYISIRDMKNAVDFLVERFGKIDVPEINVLFRRWQHDGGVSNQGFIVFNIDQSSPKQLKGISPVILSNFRDEYFVHEMAHQWWGGVISWSSYRDEWITEGFATLASVLYLEQKMSAGRFAHLIARMKRWVFKYADCGPPVYGLRIANLEGGYEAFQSVVYLKTALVLLMFRDMLGEEDFFTRLRFFLAKFKYKSITSATLINEISRKEKWLQDFFNGWLFSRKIPEVSYEVQLTGNSAELRITQKDTAFVFPLQVRIATAHGSRTQPIIVLEKEQVFKFTETAAIESLKVNATATPVLIKK